MKRISAKAVLVLCAISSSAHAGRYEWTSGWGQGVTEYLVDDGNSTELNISCGGGEDGSVSAYATVAGTEYSSNALPGFDIIVDGETWSNPFFTDCRVCAQNFEPFWKALRKANNVKISAGGKTAVVPTKNLRNVLPALSNKDNPCHSAQ